MTERTIRATVGQALVRFLTCQYTERDGATQRLFPACLGIFGHGNVAGIGQALLESESNDPTALPYILGRNEQGMVHTAVGYARAKDRLQTLPVTTSVGPGATNMVTGAALATINRIPVLLLPSDTFATRVATPVLQELELPDSGDVTVNDAFRPVSRYFDRVWRPEQLPGALLGAMRVLTDPADTGAVTVALPEDVQAQAHDWPEAVFAERVWHIGRPRPDHDAAHRAIQVIRAARAPLIIAGGGVIYSRATDSLARFAQQTGIPVAHTQAGTGALRHDHPQSVGAIGATGTTAANAIAADADVIIGIGTRYSDFTTASNSAFTNPDVRFVNINIANLDAAKNSAVSVQADARTTLDELIVELADYEVPAAHRERTRVLASSWHATVVTACAPSAGAITQTQVIGIVNTVSAPRDVVVCAAGSMPGDLHKLWQARDPKGYHVEYGYSCMGYEIAGGLGVALASPDRTVFVLVGDGSFLMMAGELVTAIQERVRLIVVVVDNRGFASIGGLSESIGSQRFGTEYRYRSADGRLRGERLPVDLAANAASLGAHVHKASTCAEFEAALREAMECTTVSVVVVETNPADRSPSSESWWDVPVAEVSALASTREARARYESARAAQRSYFRPSDSERAP
ncbi:3D-(3,5/4)-trihydroxycyclohexane-1,2-dione acylhydrolase (decyclizing) [Antrihabitans spumae]|uniref:acetolactate synthase n=1 Tax=Antrihabitans spumae TaxID=3373370 RepID=A0ABW7K2T2_9NOCA